ncbi:glycosyltransferase [Saprospiraceae bacterium]|nr:glycosyltransferase [Saprospiraceae bacterium]
MTKYLSEMGVECHVLTVDEEKASYPSIDRSLEKDIPESVKVYKTNSFEILKLYEQFAGNKGVPMAGASYGKKESFKAKTVKFIRSNFFIPDPRKGWKKYAYKKAVEIIQDNNISTVITTSPPHSTQLIGLKLKKKLGINWIVDLRDPWTDIYYYDQLRHSVGSNKINRNYEQNVLEKSDLITTVSDGFKQIFASKLTSEESQKIRILPNGYDHQDFEKLSKNKAERSFVITYTGSISDLYKPSVFFEALNDVSKMENICITLKMLGSISENIHTTISEADYEAEIISNVPHDEVIQYQMDADLLLLAIPATEGAKGILPGKIFEYLATKNRIINIGPKDGDAARIVEECGLGETFERGNKRIIIDQLKKEIDFKIKGNFPSYSKEKIAKYSRTLQAETLVKWI